VLRDSGFLRVECFAGVQFRFASFDDRLVRSWSVPSLSVPIFRRLRLRIELNLDRIC